MGCNIHCNLEYRRTKNEKYEDIDLYKIDKYFSINGFEKVCLYNERNYYLYGILAGVRNKIVTPISNQKGLPNDVSNDIKILYESSSDNHTCSYYTLIELKQAQLRYNEECLDELITLIEKRYCDTTNYGYNKKLTLEEDQNIRLVFWFDN